MARIIFVLIIASLAGCIGGDSEEPKEEVPVEDEPNNLGKPASATFPLQLSGKGGEWVVGYGRIENSLDVTLQTGFDVEVKGGGPVYSFLQPPMYTEGTDQEFRLVSHYLTNDEGMQFGIDSLQIARAKDADGQFGAQGDRNLHGIIFMFGASGPWNLTLDSSLTGTSIVNDTLALSWGKNASFTGESSLNELLTLDLIAEMEIDGGWTVTDAKAGLPAWTAMQTLGNGVSKNSPDPQNPTETYPVFGHFSDGFGMARVDVSLLSPLAVGSAGIVNFADSHEVLPIGLIREQYEF